MLDEPAQDPIVVAVPRSERADAGRSAADLGQAGRVIVDGRSELGRDRLLDRGAHRPRDSLVRVREHLSLLALERGKGMCPGQA
ncbi:MAG: hypothetical protein ACREH6_03165, partial [Geminicoccaceae bacterium]